MGPLRALLVDIGGTLVPLESIDVDWHRGRQLERLAATFGEILPWFEPVLDWSAHHVGPPDWEQPTRRRVELLLRHHDVELNDGLFERIQAACATSLHEGARVDAGAYDALVAARRMGLRLAICSDVVWVTAADSRSDWQRLGFGDLFDAFITSEDVGYCKPHRAMFETALRALGVAADDAAIIGDTPERDIAGAHALGIRTIWKRPAGFAGACIPHPDAEVASWSEVVPILRRWCGVAGSPAGGVQSGYPLPNLPRKGGGDRDAVPRTGEGRSQHARDDRSVRDAFLREGKGLGSPPQENRGAFPGAPGELGRGDRQGVWHDAGRTPEAAGG